MFRLANSVYNPVDLILAEVWRCADQVGNRASGQAEGVLFEDDQHLETDRYFGGQR